MSQPCWMVSPFAFGREMLDCELVDRDAEVRVVLDAFRDRGRLFLIGPRRFGKTSILAAASQRATRDGTKVIRVNAGEFVTNEVLAAEIHFQVLLLKYQEP